MVNKDKILPVVLSGGSGTRLWPLSRKASPKQMHALVGSHTMLQSTILRLDHLGKRVLPPVVVASELHADTIREQLTEVELSGRLVLEPIGRNTAPAIALAAELAVRSGASDQVLLVMPADHVIADAAEFCACIMRGYAEAADGALLTFGVVPESPHTGYGYIEAAGQAVSSLPVQRFVEKPSRDTAKAYLNSGSFYWNSGIFMFRADAYLSELSEHAPDIAAAVAGSMDAGLLSDQIVRPSADEFAAVRSESIDYAVMESTKNARVIRADIGWSDVGSWPSLHAALDADECGNTLEGDVLTIDVSGSLIRSESRLVAVCGLSDVVVIETGDTVLVADKSSSERVKQFVEQLKHSGRDSLL